MNKKQNPKKSVKNVLPAVAKPLTEFERQQLIAKSQAYTDEVLANSVVYPEPGTFDLLGH